MDIYPMCCDKLMSQISSITTDKFADISTYRCERCESEVVMRETGRSKMAREANKYKDNTCR